MSGKLEVADPDDAVPNDEATLERGKAADRETAIEADTLGAE